MHSALLNSHQLIDSFSRSASIPLCLVFSVCDSGGRVKKLAVQLSWEVETY